MSDDWVALYWEHLATTPPPRIWLWSWGPRDWRIKLASDERQRTILILGPVVIALWYCRCKDCTADRAVLQCEMDRIEAEGDA